MPEMQFFGLPAETINAGAVATVSYLKAEDAAGNLHDILGKHQWLPYQFYYYVAVKQRANRNERSESVHYKIRRVETCRRIFCWRT
jgi:hypothetical protein